MQDTDRQEFGALLSATLQVYGANITAPAISIWWGALGAYSLGEVRAGLAAHVMDPTAGRFAPKPADVIARIAENDGRPGADEAWALCPLDEAQTTVWTDEARQAFFDGAYRILQDGDRIAARMAFKDSYARHVATARRERRALKWSVSLGHDVGGREAPLLAALEKGRLPRPYVAGLLPHRDLTPAGKALLSSARLRLVPQKDEA